MSEDKEQTVNVVTEEHLYITYTDPRNGEKYAFGPEEIDSLKFIRPTDNNLALLDTLHIRDYVESINYAYIQLDIKRLIVERQMFFAYKNIVNNDVIPVSVESLIKSEVITTSINTRIY